MASNIPEDRPVLPPAGGGMVGRIKRILVEPKAEWPRIDAEPMTAQGVFMSWAMPLAAIGPVCGLIGRQVFGYGAFGVSFRPSLSFSITTAVLGYVLALIGVWVLALVIDWLAPNFGGTKNRDQAMKVAAFSYTAAWVAGIFQIIPMLAILAIVGLYSFYLLWLGLPLLMKAPAEKATAYTITTVVIAIVVSIVVGALTTAIAATFASPISLASASRGSVTVPGLGSIDTGKLEAASAQMSAASARMEADAQSGRPANVTPPATLQAMLPASLGGWTRGDVDSQSAGAAGVGGSSASAKYAMGDNVITLTVADIGPMGALAAMGAAMNVQSAKQTANGYERTETIDGRLTNVKWDGANHSGNYNVVVGNRFAVTAEGTAPSDGLFKSAVEAVDLGKLEAMAKS